MLTILTASMPLIIKIIIMYLEKANAKSETIKKFQSFVDAMQEDSNTTSVQRKKYANQKDRVSAMIKEIEAKEGIKK